jgi:ankyrin repeat protein
LKFLIDRGIDVNSTHHLLKGSTALIAAVQSNQWNMVDYLITANADVNQQDADGITALMYAVIYCSMTLSKKLLLAEAAKELKDNNGNTALDLAVDRQDKVLIKLLE